MCHAVLDCFVFTCLYYFFFEDLLFVEVYRALFCLVRNCVVSCRVTFSCILDLCLPCFATLYCCVVLCGCGLCFSVQYQVFLFYLSVVSNAYCIVLSWPLLCVCVCDLPSFWVVLSLACWSVVLAFLIHAGGGFQVGHRAAALYSVSAFTLFGCFVDHLFRLPGSTRIYHLTLPPLHSSLHPFPPSTTSK